MEEGKSLVVASPRGITPFDLAVRLAACGVGQGAIAEDTGLTPREVTVLLQTEEAKFLIKRFLHKYFQNDPKKRYQAMLSMAQDAQADVLMDPTAKNSEKLAAASAVVDRAMGKTAPTEDKSGSAIRRLFEQLDERKRQAEGGQPEPVAREIFDLGEMKENPNETKPVDSNDVDRWVDQNL